MNSPSIDITSVTADSRSAGRGIESTLRFLLPLPIIFKRLTPQFT